MKTDEVLSMLNDIKRGNYDYMSLTSVAKEAIDEINRLRAAIAEHRSQVMQLPFEPFYHLGDTRKLLQWVANNDGKLWKVLDS